MKKKTALQEFKEDRARTAGKRANSYNPDLQVEIDAENKLLLLDALQKSNGLVNAACKMAKINPTAFYRMFNADPAFKEAVNEIRQVGFDLTEEALFDLIEQRNPQVVIYAMKALGKDRGYAERQEVTGKDGTPLTHETIVILPPKPSE